MEPILQRGGQRGILGGGSYRAEELIARVWHTRMGQGLLQSGRVLTRVWLTRVGEQLGFLQSRGGEKHGVTDSIWRYRDIGHVIKTPCFMCSFVRSRFSPSSCMYSQ